MDREEVLHAAAANLAGWHDCSVRALGFPTATGAWWWTAATPSPWIYFTAIEVRRARTRTERRDALAEVRRHLGDPSGSFEAVCDNFDSLDLDRAGLQRRSRGRWYARPAGPLDDIPVQPDGVVREATSTDDLAAFERATCLSFAAPPPVAPGDIHAPGILDDPAMHVFIGEALPDEGPAGPVVAGAMAYVHGGVVGIYGVGTVPGHRNQGWATALTTACLAVAPDRPATLQPSAAAAAMYQRLGFVDQGEYHHWA